MKSVAALILLFVAYAAATGARHEMTEQEIAAADDLLAGIDLENELYNKKRITEMRMVRHSVAHATSQIVAGTLYKAKVHFVVSTCKNVEENDGKLLGECPAKEHTLPVTCIISVWSRKWVKEPMKKLITKTEKCLRM